MLLLNITAFTCIIRLKRHQTRHSALWYLYFFPAIKIFTALISRGNVSWMLSVVQLLAHIITL